MFSLSCDILQIWALWQICQNLPTHLGNFLCCLMSILKGCIILLKDYTVLKPSSCVGIHLIDTLMKLRCSLIIF